MPRSDPAGKSEGRLWTIRPAAQIGVQWAANILEPGYTSKGDVIMFSNHPDRKSAANRKARRLRPAAEALEARAVQTIIFAPALGAEVASYHGGTLLHDTPVNLIFWGKEWALGNGPKAQPVIDTAKQILASPYLSGLDQYSNNPGIVNAHLAGTAFVGSAVVPNFSTGDITDVIKTALSQGSLADPYNANPTPLFLVVTPPGYQSNSPTAASYHNSVVIPHFSGNPIVPLDLETRYEGWIQDDGNPDDVANFLSHEIVEAVTDPGANDSGISVAHGAQWTRATDDFEIGDAEAQSYSYRLNGRLVQSYWSQADSAYIVPDGNAFPFYVSPKTTLDAKGNPHVQGGTLTINGNPNGGGNFTLDVAPNGGVRVTVQGQTPQVATFEPGQITSVVVSMGGKLNPGTVTILKTAANAPVTIIPGGKGTVNIGQNGNAQNIKGSINILGINTPGLLDVNIDDSKDVFGRNFTVAASSVSGLTPADVTFSPSVLRTLHAFSGLANDSATVTGTPSNPLYLGTLIDTGGGQGNAVQINRVDSPLSFLASQGNASVTVGEFNVITKRTTTAAILSGVSIDAGPTAAVDLTINDSGDFSSRTVGVNQNGGVGVSGLAPGGISWKPTLASVGGVTHAAVFAGQQGNTFNIAGTPNMLKGLDLHTGYGNDNVNVSGLTGILNIDGQAGLDSFTVGNGTLAGINGALNLYNSLGSTTLTIADHKDAAPQKVALGNGTIAGLTGTPITYTVPQGLAGGVSNLILLGGQKADTIDVLATPVPTTVNAGPGDDSVYAASTQKALTIDGGAGIDLITLGRSSKSILSQLAGFNGPAAVKDSGADATLVLNDTADTSARTSFVYSGEVDGLSPVPILYAAGQVNTLKIYNGAAANIDNVVSTPLGSTTSIYGSYIGETFNVGDANHGLDGILGGVVIDGGAGTDALNVKDAASSQLRGYVLNKNALTTSHQGSLTYNAVESMNVGMSSGAATLTLLNPMPAIPVTVKGGGGVDNLIGPAASNAWSIAGPDSGSIGAVSFSAIQNLTGGAMGDTFSFAPGGSLSGGLNGGASPAGTGDWLDASARTAPISVNLSTGLASPTLVGGKVLGIEGVRGGSGGNTLTGGALPCVLVGGVGVDVLAAASGRAILIGGAGADTLSGGADDTILIGGRTAYDADTAALDALLAAWTAVGPSNAARIASIRAGVGPNGADKLNPATVIDDLAADVLISGTGPAWIWTATGPVKDKVANKKATDTVN